MAFRLKLNEHSSPLLPGFPIILRTRSSLALAIPIARLLAQTSFCFNFSSAEANGIYGFFVPKAISQVD